MFFELFKIYFQFSFECMVSDYNFKFSQPSGACVVEVTHLLETAKACGSNPTGKCFFFANFICAFLDNRPSAYFCRRDCRNPIFEVSAFFQVAITPMLETKKPRSSIPVGTCFFSSLKFASSTSL